MRWRQGDRDNGLGARRRPVARYGHCVTGLGFAAKAADSGYRIVGAVAGSSPTPTSAQHESIRPARRLARPMPRHASLGWLPSRS